MKKQYKRHGRVWQISDEEFSLLVQTSLTINEIMRKLGFANGKGGHSGKGLHLRIIELGLDLSHLESSQARRLTRDQFYLPEEWVLIANSPYRSNLARKIFRKFKGVTYQCSICEQPPIWRGKELVLVFDHIDGDNRNHLPSNLRWLCPNCNSQTDTFCGKNISNPKRRTRATLARPTG